MPEAPRQKGKPGKINSKWLAVVDRLLIAGIKLGLMDKNESMEYLLKKLNFREDKPKFIDANPISQMAEGLREGMVECAGTEKV